MSPAVTDVMKVWRVKGETTISVSLADLRYRLTDDGEIAALGFTHYYLATWIARMKDGRVQPPRRWPRLTYEYVAGSHITLPVLKADAKEVMRTLAMILERPGSLESSLEEPTG